MLFPNIIWEVAKNYNNAFILCEVNDIGDQVASILQYDLEYQNLLMCSMRGKVWSNCWTRIFWKENTIRCQDE